MIDIWIKSKNKTALDNFIFVQSDEGQTLRYPNTILPKKGSDYIAEYSEGEYLYPAMPAIGDSDYWYACIRSNERIDLPDDLIEITQEECSLVCGVWS